MRVALPTRSAVRASALRGLRRRGWRWGRRIPAPVVRGILAVAARWTLQRNGPEVRTLRRNLSGLLGRPVNDDLVRRALDSTLRYYAEQLTLPGWPPEEIRRRVHTVDEHVLRTAYATTGAVVALPHSGNWDLAGAWAGLTGMPVTTVAEELAGPDYADYLAFRRRLDLEVLGHADPGVIGLLVDAVRRGRLVCLVADRDLTGKGLSVTWNATPLTMPGGPALVARRSGATLVPAVCRYRGPDLEIVFGDPVPAQPGRDGLTAMTQQVADFFASTLAEQPQDWHLLQPFFPDPTVRAGGVAA